MRKFFVLLVVVAAAVLIFTLSEDGGDGPPYASFATHEGGTSLFFDTLRYMGYPVRARYAPLTARSNTAHVYIIIHPYNPPVDTAMAAEMLDWVYAGGRLIFLHSTMPAPLDNLLARTQPQILGAGLAHYYHGQGEVITGRAWDITNQHLRHNPAMGNRLHEQLSVWDAPRIWFNEYYHGLGMSDTLFLQMPLIARLTAVQLGIATVAFVWLVGKRFGKPVPLYEEVEREENEHVRALARLYAKTSKTRRKKNAKKYR